MCDGEFVRLEFSCAFVLIRARLWNGEPERRGVALDREVAERRVVLAATGSGAVAAATGLGRPAFGGVPFAFGGVPFAFGAVATLGAVTAATATETTGQSGDSNGARRPGEFQHLTAALSRVLASHTLCMEEEDNNLCIGENIRA